MVVYRVNYSASGKETGRFSEAQLAASLAQHREFQSMEILVHKELNSVPDYDTQNYMSFGLSTQAYTGSCISSHIQIHTH